MGVGSWALGVACFQCTFAPLLLPCGPGTAPSHCCRILPRSYSYQLLSHLRVASTSRRHAATTGHCLRAPPLAVAPLAVPHCTSRSPSAVVVSAPLLPSSSPPHLLTHSLPLPDPLPLCHTLSTPPPSPCRSPPHLAPSHPGILPVAAFAESSPVAHSLVLPLIAPSHSPRSPISPFPSIASPLPSHRHTNTLSLPPTHSRTHISPNTYTTPTYRHIPPLAATPTRQ